MINNVVVNALKIINGYLNQNYSNKELLIIHDEINNIIGEVFGEYKSLKKYYTYEEMQDVLATLNEKESIRKNKGVYYTPIDVVEFILINSVKQVCNILKPNNLHVLDLNGIPYSTICYKKTIYDPCCGSGVFLLAALDLKLNLLDLHHATITNDKINRVVETIKGNDLNNDSIIITKLRLLLYILHRYGVEKIRDISKILNSNFESYDYVEDISRRKVKYDIIIGNPPYVEDAKSESKPLKKYGNIYANVLENAAMQLKTNGVLGFIIPLSYVSTPRMKGIRDELYEVIPEQYILSYADRPDCLFTSVHQKLCILIGKNKKSKSKKIFTGNYKYWYKNERKKLFDEAEVVQNTNIRDDYIPKLGTIIDVGVYKRIERQRKPILNLMERGNNPLYLNMRAAFWIKVFLNEHNGSEYKIFKCKSEDEKNYCMCLLSSSLFWWYWICVSDCWHITRKELLGFKIPEIEDYTEINKLAKRLEEQLEKTKLYVGTKQTEYEYKHKSCVKTIHQIDDYINNLFGLTEEESLYIKNFAYRYRIGGGAEDECN